ncbi:uncharacterized protein A4U43_C05F16550 [Asparagus officinalis]|uniref:Strictosidine synthase conserved region domain-containing protein n=1 Tax=Asparagus officinalis TaxID=4686 RepID=A0A5P1EVY7_ASPOF|nr:uncharacterized protein A4U43_C05F16550 [Asparagus officinalis]
MCIYIHPEELTATVSGYESRHVRNVAGSESCAVTPTLGACASTAGWAIRLRHQPSSGFLTCETLQGPEGGLAAQLVAEVEGRPLRFTNDLDIDEDGNVYFTESSTYFQRRLSRYWLKGEKAGTSETFVILPGHPDNVRTNAKGEFWVAIHCRRTLFLHVFNLCPRLRKFIFKFPIKAQYIYTRYIGGKHHGMIVKYSEDGSLLRVLEDREGKVVRAVSEVEEHDGKLWIGSVLMPFIAVY